MLTILVVDDDRTITDMLRRTLTYEGYHVLTAADGPEALAQAQAHHPDLVVLDWLMPGLDGLEVARRLRTADGTPILMLTARDAVEDRVVGLDSGADDYLVKPFAPAELLARVRALLRRAGASGPAGEMRPLSYAGLWLDPVTRETRRGTRAFALSPKEFDLLHHLMARPGQVFGRDELFDAVWDPEFAGDPGTLSVHVRRLREKIEPDPSRPRHIETVWGSGYRLSP